MPDIRITVPFEQATVAEASDSDPIAAELYRMSEPLVRGVFPTITEAEYQGMSTRRHVTFAKVAGRMNPKLLEACDLTLADLGIDDVE
jgi:hypothetical protein